MTTLFFDDFSNGVAQWSGTNLLVRSDPISGAPGHAATFSAATIRPSAVSNPISNPSGLSWTISFDMMSVGIGSYTGCILSMYDGDYSSSTLPLAIAGSLSRGVLTTDHTIRYYPSYLLYNDAYDIRGDFILLRNTGAWEHYSISFTTLDSFTRIALTDYLYAAGSTSPGLASTENNVVGDCYFRNIMVTDSNGPTPFIGTPPRQAFSAIVVSALGLTANAVSYQNSASAVNCQLSQSATIGVGGDAEGDSYDGTIKVLIGSAYRDRLTISNCGSCTVYGGDESDVLVADSGTLYGGAGYNKYIISDTLTAVTLADFNTAKDILDLRRFGVTNLAMLQSVTSYTNGDTRISIGGSKVVTMKNVSPNDLKAANFCFYGTAQACGNNPPVSSSFGVSFSCQYGSSSKANLPFAEHVSDVEDPAELLNVMFTALPSSGAVYDSTTSLEVVLGKLYNALNLEYFTNNCTAGVASSLRYKAVDSDGYESGISRADISISPLGNRIAITKPGTYMGSDGNDIFTLALNTSGQVTIVTGGGNDKIQIHETYSTPLITGDIAILDFDSTKDQLEIASLNGNCSGIMSSEFNV